MTGYLVRRTLQMALVLLFASMAIYGVLNAAPGGPLSGLRLATGRERISNADIQRMQAILGLDKPLHLRYLSWLKRAVTLDWGTSWTIARGQPVSMLIKSRLGNTILLMSAATLLSLVIAIPIGIYSAYRQYSTADYAATAFAFFGIAMPVFWLGLMMVILFTYQFQRWGLPYLPPGDVASLRTPQPASLLGVLNIGAGTLPDKLVHLIMPSIVLSLLYMATWMRFMRSGMLEVLRQDYVRTARAKGLAERIVVGKHALRNALIPLVTIITLQIPSIFGGAVVTETVFNWKGIGRLYIDSIYQNDWPVTMALLFISAVLVVLATLLADFLYSVVDPRVRFGD